jgi:hypothetical protein
VSLAEFSTIDSYSAADNHSERRTDGKKYSVNTISLEDLLDKYNAPKEVDFLSIDTEGSEFEILRNFDFNKYQFRVIACEHNYGPDRARIESLLIQNGYRRKLEEFSNWDDWYVRAE